ncbi:MAG: hypothetical protein H6737_18075 [Alphaproteobacteria bacterium]|nr:hypothetical protein [Alphaproteobacteria bacterium]
MRASLALLPSAVVIGFSLACTGGISEPPCDLTVDNLAGKSFIMSEAQPDGPDKLNALARLTFVDDGGLKAKYTAMSLGDIYTYDCEKQEKDGKFEQKCSEKERLQDWCEALLAWDKSCTAKKLKKLGSNASDEEIDKAMDAAKSAHKEAEKGEEKAYKMWKLRRANLGNKLQGQLYAKVDEKKCRLRIDDLYWTLYDGEKREDSNPVGTNPFVKADQPWMFEHCDNQADLWDLETDEFPTKPLEAAPTHAPGKAIYYFHTGETGSKPEEGCTYSFDTYAGWLPLQQGQTPTTNADGRLIWRAEYAFDDGHVRDIGGKQIGIFHMARFKECGGKKERIDVSCRATPF